MLAMAGDVLSLSSRDVNVERNHLRAGTGIARLIASGLVLLVIARNAYADPGEWQWGGHTKALFNYLTFPEDSVFREATGANSSDYSFDGRFKLRYDNNAWEVAADYQLIARYGDAVALSRQLSDLAIVPGAVPNDSLRVLNLTDTLVDGGDAVAVQRLDRLYVTYNSEDWVARLGRQVISWGNGLVYSAMDFINPFDPAAVDKEYKVGDDMVYGQYLWRSGNDLQTVLVGRRDADTGNVDRANSTLAAKYHGFAGVFEYDILLSQHYGDTVAGVGGNRSIGGAVWRGDVTLTRTDTETVPLVVTSLSWSWMWGGKNASGVVEYFYSGFGIRSGEYSEAELAAKPDLSARLQRGELFTLGRNYVVTSVVVELTPLFLLTPNIFINLDDPSALVQVVGQYDVAQNFLLLAAINAPIGSPGTEYGGINSGVDGLYLSSGPSLYLQLAWYF
jgi:hypothetical protein